MSGRQPGAASRYLPIADHGLIGDLHTVALVGTNGTIDWFCWPWFDSPSLFGSILDAEKGGFFSIAPVNDGHNAKQLYLPDTNVLITRFLTPDGVGEVEDFMPIRRDPNHMRRPTNAGSGLTAILRRRVGSTRCPSRRPGGRSSAG